MREAIFEILQKASEFSKKQEKIDYLRKMYNPALGMVLRGAYDPTIVWELPEGSPPYKPSEFPDTHGILYGEVKRLYLFIKGGHPNLNQLRREQLYITLLESVHPEDAKILLAIKDKKLPYKSITANIVKEAFPGLLNEQQ
jgi:hypothetical protein